MICTDISFQFKESNLGHSCECIGKLRRYLIEIYYTCKSVSNRLSGIEWRKAGYLWVMRILHFLLTLFVTMFTMLSADVKHILPMYALSAGLWFIFMLAQRPRIRRRQARQQRAYLQEQCMRAYLRNNDVRY